MKCEKCGKDFPSDYYFKTNTICKSCFEALNEEDKKLAYKKNQTKSTKEEAVLAPVHSVLHLRVSAEQQRRDNNTVKCYLDENPVVILLT